MPVGGGIAAGALVGAVASDRASSKAAKASERAAEIQATAGGEAIQGQREAAERAQGFFEPFAGVAEQGVAGASFLTDPQERFEFLQNNPLFDLQLENLNQRTQQQASSQRRLSFGDTLQQLSNNVLLASQPLLATQDRNLTNLLSFGGDVATSQANIETGQAARIGGLTTDIGAAGAAGLVGAANAANAGTAGLAQALQTGILAASNRFGGGGTQVPTSGAIRTVNPFTPPPAAPINPFAVPR